jgi:hypothetical protein
MHALPVLHSSLDIGFLVGLIVMGVVVLVTTVIGILFVSTDAGNRGKDFAAWIAAYFVEAAVIAFILFPFQPAYWHYDIYSGTVVSVSSRFVSNSSGNGSSQKYVVQLTNGDALGCLDTRCALLQPGDKVELECEKQWEWNGQPGYDCNWGAGETKAGIIQ